MSEPTPRGAASPASPGRRRRQAGFTLVEMLVTLAIMAMLFAMVGSVLTGFLLAEKKITHTLARERVGAAILEVIQKDVQGCYAYQIPRAFVGTDRGEEDRVEFLTTRPPAFETEDEDEEGERDERRASAFGDDYEDDEDGGFTVGRPTPLELTKVGYFVQQSTGSDFLTLFRYEAPYVPPPPPDPSAPRPAGTQRGGGPFDDSASADSDDMSVFEIYDRVRTFDVRYLNADGEWQDRWEEDEIVPLAIEVTILVEPDGAPARTGYEGRFEESRRGQYQTVIGLPIDLPDPDEDGQPRQQRRPR